MLVSPIPEMGDASTAMHTADDWHDSYKLTESILCDMLLNNMVNTRGMTIG